jgi:hypothetical protein
MPRIRNCMLHVAMRVLLPKKKWVGRRQDKARKVVQFATILHLFLARTKYETMKFLFELLIMPKINKKH